MPGPPPPSKSYTWVFDTDTEDEDDEETMFAVPPSTASRQCSYSTVTTADSTEPDEAVSEVKRKKKKRKKKKKKKSKTKADPAVAAAASPKVQFGTVTVRQFERCLGLDVVPGDGGWPLGMERHALKEETVSISVEDFEAERKQVLQERYDALVATGKLEKDHVVEAQLETRQWDYKSVKNPLFHLLKEEERMNLLLEKKPDTPSNSKKGRSRSGSFSDRPSGRTRSSSRNLQEEYNDKYPQVEVHHVRNELEQIRYGRGKTGCDCRKLHVYLLPPGGGGKKAHHRRMNERKVKEELRKRGLLPSKSCSREELELLLHKAVEEEPCCWGDDCSCHRDGIGCQADACRCWMDSHQAKKTSTTFLSVEEIRNRCGNGMYTVDTQSIDQFRKEFLCTVIATGNK